MQFGWRVRGLLLLALMATVTMMVLIQKKVSKSHMLEIVTYLEGYEPYPVEEGDPVCLTGVVGLSEEWKAFARCKMIVGKSSCCSTDAIKLKFQPILLSC